MKSHSSGRPSLIAPVVFAALVAACASPSASAPAGAGSESPLPVSESTGTAGGAAATPPPGDIGSAAPLGPPSVDEPCTLLTPAEITQVTGFEIKWTFPTEAGGELPVGCNWSLGTAEVGADIVIGVRSPGGAALFDPSRGDAVDGIGDAALQSEAAVVEAVKGDTFVSLTYIASEGDHAEITRQLTRLIMGKL